MSTQSGFLTPILTFKARRAKPRTAQILTLHGEYDADNAPKLWKSIRALIQQSRGDLVLDLSGVTFMDASTIRIVVLARQLLETQSHRLVLRAPPTCATRILDICGMNSLVEQSPQSMM